MKVFDFRLRPPYKSFLQCDFFNYATSPFAWHSAPPASFNDRSFATLKQEAAAAGVVRAVVWGRSIHDPKKSSTNDDVAAIVREHSDLFVAGFGGMAPMPGNIGATLTEIERSVKTLGLKGMTLEAGLGMKTLSTPDDPNLYPIYECLQAFGVILAMTISRGSRPEQTLMHSNPEAVDRISRDFPELKIVVSHAFWPWVQQGCGVAFRRPNVYLIPDLYGMGMPGTTDWIAAANTAAQDQIIFGSAYPYLGVEEMVESYSKLPYKDSVREKVMYKNAQRLLDMVP